MKLQKVSLIGTTILLLVVGLTISPAAAGEEGARVEVKKIVKCEGDDCGDREIVVKRVVVDEDGVRTEIEGDDFEWHGDGAYAFAHHHGDHGKGGFLGVALTELTPELRRHFGVSEDRGVMVSKVVTGSPAERAGVRVGDVIAAVDGESVASARALAARIRSHQTGGAVNLEIWRDGRLETLSAEVEVREGPARLARVIRVECEDGEDCGDFKFESDFDFDCGGAARCEVKVDCRDGSCDCSINGETAECAAIPGVPAR